MEHIQEESPAPDGDSEAKKTSRRRKNQMYFQSPKNCTTCEESTRVNDGHWHHIVPRVLGGGENYGNLIFVCVKCHSLIHGRDATNHRALVMEGLQKAEDRGVKFGAPVKITDAMIDKIKKCRAEEMSMKQISVLLQISVGSVCKALKIDQRSSKNNAAA